VLEIETCFLSTAQCADRESFRLGLMRFRTKKFATDPIEGASRTSGSSESDRVSDPSPNAKP